MESGCFGLPVLTDRRNRANYPAFHGAAMGDVFDVGDDDVDKASSASVDEDDER